MTEVERDDYDISDVKAGAITFVKRLQIYVSSQGPSGPLNDLRFHIYGFTKDWDDVDEGAGIDIDMGDIDQVIDAFVDADPIFPQTHPIRNTPLDFSIKKPCFVVLKLIGDFWEFMPTPPKKGAVRTKTDQRERYCDLRTYTRDGKIRAIAFCVQEIKPNGSSKDGINLYVDFVDGKLRLPVIIDPDIENKGDDHPLDVV